jgi:hypothetical protein
VGASSAGSSVAGRRKHPDENDAQKKNAKDIESAKNARIMSTPEKFLGQRSKIYYAPGGVKFKLKTTYDLSVRRILDVGICLTRYFHGDKIN